MKIQFRLEALNPTQLAKIYLGLVKLDRHADATKVRNAGIANCGKDDFDYEVKRVSKAEGEIMKTYIVTGQVNAQCDYESIRVVAASSHDAWTIASAERRKKFIVVSVKEVMSR